MYQCKLKVSGLSLFAGSCIGWFQRYGTHFWGNFRILKKKVSTFVKHQKWDKCLNSVSVAIDSKTSKIYEINFIRTKMMTESLYLYGEQFIEQGCLWQKFGVILHH